MTYIDAAVLNLIEWCCRRFQVLTGRTNVWLAVQLTNLSIIVYFVVAGMYFWSRDVSERIALGLFCSALLYVLTQTVLKEPIEAYENAAYRRVAKGFRNPRRVRDALLRISFLTLSLVLFYPVLLVSVNLRVPMAPLTYSLIVLTTVVLYLLACDPLPPCAGKVREWLRRSAPSRQPAPESSRGAVSTRAQLPPTLRGVRERGTKPRVDIVFQGWSVFVLGARVVFDAASSAD
jgi:hypothetical protein